MLDGLTPCGRRLLQPGLHGLGALGGRVRALRGRGPGRSGDLACPLRDHRRDVLLEGLGDLTGLLRDDRRDVLLYGLGDLCAQLLRHRGRLLRRLRGRLRPLVQALDGLGLGRERWCLAPSLESADGGCPAQELLEGGAAGGGLEDLRQRELLLPQKIVPPTQHERHARVHHELEAVRIGEERVPQARDIGHRQVLGEQHCAPPEDEDKWRQLAIL
mmetsp:Transcript_101967/g.297387  ORF Transcript_101967/g.297387 Transcript_101967/m.297387 type:complete len:216 (+) Transcript_101967:229-876(+)